VMLTSKPSAPIDENAKSIVSHRVDSNNIIDYE
jgi:hypothetical protein